MAKAKKNVELPKKNQSLNFKDVITITLSVAAFVLSLLNFYFTNYRIHDSVSARAIDIDTKYYDNYINLNIKVLFTNSGNRQSMLKVPSFQVADTLKPRKGTWSNLVRVVNENAFPIILQPHEMKIVDLEIPLSEIINRPGKKSHGGIDNYKLAIIYFSIDSKANNI